jgi:hypothetical protein
MHSLVISAVNLLLQQQQLSCHCMPIVGPTEDLNFERPSETVAGIQAEKLALNLVDKRFSSQLKKRN